MIPYSYPTCPFIVHIPIEIPVMNNVHTPVPVCMKFSYPPVFFKE